MRHNKRMFLTALALLVGLMASAPAADEPTGLKLTKSFNKRAAGSASAHLNAEGDRLAFAAQEAAAPNGAFARFGISKTYLLDNAGKELAEIKGATPIGFAPGGRTLLVSQNFMPAVIKAGNFQNMPVPMAQLWELAEEKKPKQRYVIDGVAIEAFSPDGKLLGCLGGPEQKFGNAGRVVVGLPKVGRQTGNLSLRFVEIWEVESARMLVRANAPKGYTLHPSLAFTPDSKFLVIPVENQPNFDPRNPQDNVNKLRKDRTSKFLLFDVAAKKVTKSIETKGVIRSFAVVGKPQTALGKSYLAVGLQDDDKAQVKLFNLETGETAATLFDEQIPKDHYVLLTVEAAPDGETLATNFVAWTPAPAQNQPQGQPNPGRGGIGGGFGANGGLGGGNQPPKEAPKGKDAPKKNGVGGGFGAAGGGALGVAGGAGAQGGGAIGVGGGGAFGVGGAAGNAGGVGGFAGGNIGFGGGAVGFGGGMPAANIGFGGGAMGFGGGFGGGGFNGFAGGAPNGFVPANAGVGVNSNFTKSEVVFWDLDTKARRHTLKLPAHSARFAGNRTVAALVIEKESAKLKLWDVLTGKELASIDDCLYYDSSSDGTILLTSIRDGNDQELTVWKAERGPMMADPPAKKPDE